MNEKTGKMESYKASVKRKTWVDPYAEAEETDEDFEEFEDTVWAPSMPVLSKF